MATLDRYLLTRMIGALARAVVSFVLLFVLIDLLTHRKNEIIKHDVPWLVVFKYYLLFTPQILSKYQIAALAVLVSGLLVLGQAAQENEVTAALAGGISLWRFVRMPIIVGLALAVTVLILLESVGASTCREAIRIEDEYFSRNPSIKRRAVSWARLSGKWTCHIDKFNPLALTGEDVLIYSFGDERDEQIEARRIFWDPDLGRWLLEDGRMIVFESGAGTISSYARITQQPAPFLERPEDLLAAEQPPETKTAWRLAADIARARSRGTPVQGLLVDLHAKFSQPALSFVMIWLAVPFAIRLRRGGLAISFGLSVAIALSYLAVFGMGMALGHAERLAPAVAAWLPNVIFFTLGSVLLWRTPT